MVNLIYPLFYYCRPWSSDRDGIHQRMKVIPAGQQQEVANQYERLFMVPEGGRKAANAYLDKTAREFMGKEYNK